MISINPVRGIPEVNQGDDLAALIVSAAGPGAIVTGDVVVVAQKAVSKAEGRVLESATKTEAAIAESHRILRRSGDMVISETRHGFVCANAGVDASNVEPGRLVLLPLDPDLSARRLRARLKVLCDVDVAVVISDTFGRPWRIGQTDIAIGVAGIEPFIDYRGRSDSYGNELHATQICVADELAGAAELAMGKANGICAAIVRGAATTTGRGSAKAIVRPPREDLFR